MATRLRGAVTLSSGILLTVAGVSAQSEPAPKPAEGRPTPDAQTRGADGGNAPSSAASGTPAGQKVGESPGQEETPQVTGGYSWSDSPRQRRPRRARVEKLDPSTPVATFPGFRLLPDGTSLVWVSLSKRVTVTEHRSERRVSYLLEGAGVQVFNNTHQLLTEHFNTPVQRAWLSPTKPGAVLTIELREPAELDHEVALGPQGSMVLRVRVPRPSRPYATSPAETPLEPVAEGTLRISRSLQASAPRGAPETSFDLGGDFRSQKQKHKDRKKKRRKRNRER